MKLYVVGTLALSLVCSMLAIPEWEESLQVCLTRPGSEVLLLEGFCTYWLTCKVVPKVFSFGFLERFCFYEQIVKKYPIMKSFTNAFDGCFIEKLSAKTMPTDTIAFAAALLSDEMCLLRWKVFKPVCTKFLQILREKNKEKNEESRIVSSFLC